MNETIKIIMTRRSIRKYQPEQISRDELQTILEAGTFAPSAMNQQPWHFTVIQNRELFQKLNEACKTALVKTNNKSFAERTRGISLENFNIFHHAPTLIIVSGDEQAIAPQNDCSLALENMFLAAESLGIGSCWMHAIKLFYATDDGKTFLHQELQIPEGYTPVGSGVFGYKAGESPAAPARKTGTITIFD